MLHITSIAAILSALTASIKIYEFSQDAFSKNLIAFHFVP